MLPKSLHTVRILVAVADALPLSSVPFPMTLMQSVIAAANVCGYPDASETDPLIVKAAAQLAAQSVRAVA